MKLLKYILPAILFLSATAFIAKADNNLWFLSGGTKVRPNVSTWSLLIPQLGGSGTKCIHVDNTGLFSTTAADCGSGSGGGSTFTGIGFNVTGGTFVHATSLSFDPGGFNVSNTASNGFVFLDYTNGPASRSIAQTITGLWDFNATPTSIRTKGNVGIGLSNTPQTTLEVWGTASASNLLSLGSVQFANAGATVSYSRFGTAVTSHPNYISGASDLLLSNDFEVKGTASFQGVASISGNLLVGTSSKGGNVGIGMTIPTTRFEAFGTASVDYFVSKSTVQFANAGATVAYSRFGNTASIHTNYMAAANDLLISGDFESRATAAFAGLASFSARGLLGRPAVGINGDWATSGTATTTKPQLLIEPSGAVSTAWNTSGTGLGVNASSGFLGLLADFQKNGTSQVSISRIGVVTLNTVTNATANTTLFFNSLNTSTNGLIGFAFRSNGANISPTAGINQQVAITDSALYGPSTGNNTYNIFEEQMGIRQTATAKGVNRGIYINPTGGTSPINQGIAMQAYDFRDFEIASHTYRIHGTNVAGGINKTYQSALFNPITYSSASANTLNSAYGIAIAGAPIASASVTITKSVAFTVLGKNVTAASGVVASAYGLMITAPSGASTNVGASISGRVFLPGITGANTTDYVCYNTGTGEIDNSSAACTISSKRFKTDIKVLVSSGLTEVLKMKPVTFRYKKGFNDNGKKLQVGFIAEDAAQVDTKLVEFDKQGLPYSFDYMNYTAVLTKAIQELFGKLDDLIAKVTGISKRTTQLEAQVKELQLEVKQLQKRR